MEKPYYKRVLLKLSGEALAGEQGYGIDPQTITTIADEVREVVACGVELALVGAAAPALAAVDVSVDTIVCPRLYATWFWWFTPTVRARCRGTDSAAMSAWFTMHDKHDSIRYRDSLVRMVMLTV